MKTIVKLVTISALYLTMSGCVGIPKKTDPLPLVKTASSSLPKETSAPTFEVRGTRQENGAVVFVYLSDASEVYISGEFNNWSSSSDKMQRDSDGNLSLKKSLSPGNYRYMFIVDGDWITDPTNPEKDSDGRGGENSLILVN